jgi:hypothetical protein
LRFWTLSIVLFLFKTHNVSEAGFCVRLQVESIQFGPIDRVSPYLQTPAPTQEVEDNDTLPLLDVLVIEKGPKFTTREKESRS